MKRYLYLAKAPAPDDYKLLYADSNWEYWLSPGGIICHYWLPNLEWRTYPDIAMADVNEHFMELTIAWTSEHEVVDAGGTSDQQAEGAANAAGDQCEGA